MERHFPVKETLLVASTLGRVIFFTCPAEQSQHAIRNSSSGRASDRESECGGFESRFQTNSRSAHSDTHFFRAPPDKPNTQNEVTGSIPVEGSCALVAQW